MSAEQNKAVARSYIEAQAKDADYLEFFATSYISHFRNEALNRDAQKQLPMKYYSAFSDKHATIEDLVAEGDKVAIRVNCVGLTVENSWASLLLEKSLRLLPSGLFES